MAYKFKQFHQFAWQLRAFQKRDEDQTEWFETYFLERKLPTLITDEKALPFYQLLSEVFAHMFEVVYRGFEAHQEVG
jgi:hypothetical protein